MAVPVYRVEQVPTYPGTTGWIGAYTYAPAFIEIFLLFIILLPLMLMPIILFKAFGKAFAE